MRISFENNPSVRTEKNTTSYHAAEAGKGKPGCGYARDISDKVTENLIYGLGEKNGFRGGRQGKGLRAQEVMQSAENTDITVYRNYMTVMSHSMSDEDFAKLEKEGYHPADMDLQDAVDILDTIKAELLKAGVEIVGYTDSLDAGKLAEITGSPAYAEQLAGAFAKEDVPLTQENAEQAAEAFTRGKELTEMSEGSLQYMVENEMQPEIENLYLAQHAVAGEAEQSAKGYFSEEMPGYYTQKASEADLENLMPQIEAVVRKAGYPVTDENVADGMWLIEKNVPLTEESYSLLKDIKQVQLPASDKALFASIAAAITEGRNAERANLNEQKSVYRRAAESFLAFEGKYRALGEEQSSPETIKARRQLEEIRLLMTVEANVKLLKSDFAIDTAPMEDLIDALRQLEQDRISSAPAEQKPADICRETLRKTREIPFLPHVATGRVLAEGNPLTIDNVYEAGVRLREDYRQAGEAYETMMTTPRADMGDNIRTAFRNIDALLENMGAELTEENRRAVRSLSRNQMELTEENLLAVKQADKVVQRVVEKMTPPAVLSMIRDGVNPLKTPMEELEKYLSERDTYAEESTEYGRFLYRLEKNHEVTEEEKASYIGIYRLLRQIEKSDGGAIGRLVGAQAEINFENLLSAVRTGKLKGVNVSVDENYGSLKDALEKGVSIATQIDTAYEKELLKEVRAADKTNEEALQLLKQLNQPVTIENLLAADEIWENGAAPFKKLKEALNKTEAAESGEMDLPEEAFTDKDSMQEAYGKLISHAEEAVRTITFAEGIGSVDVRALQLACKQLHIQSVRAVQNEEYDIPQMIDGELTAVHLKLVHNSQENGKVSVSVDTMRYGHLSGEFSMEGNNVSGFFTGEKEAVEALEKVAESFTARLEKSNFKAKSIQVVEGSLKGRAEKSSEKTETKELYKVAGMAISALKEGL